MSWPVEALVVRETGDGSVWGRSEEGGEKALKPQSSMQSFAEDLRWVPPWFPLVTNSSRRRISSHPCEMRSSMEAGSCRCSTTLSKSKARSQMVLKVLICRSDDNEVCDLLNESSRPINGRLGLSIDSGRTVLLRVDSSMLYFACGSEVLIILDLNECVLHDRGLYFSSLLGSREFMSNSSIHDALLLIAMERKVFRGERDQSFDPNINNWALMYIFAQFGNTGYAWSNHTLYIADDLLGSGVEYGRMARCIALNWYIWFLDDRIIKLSIVSGLVHTVLRWVDILLFSVLRNTVHIWIQCLPVQWVWECCSSWGWNCGSFIYCHTDCVLFANVFIDDLLEYHLVSRKFVRNLFYRWILLEADLVNQWDAKASLDGLALCVGYFDLYYNCSPFGPWMLWMICLFLSYFPVSLLDLYWLYVFRFNVYLF